MGIGQRHLADGKTRAVIGQRLSADDDRDLHTCAQVWSGWSQEPGGSALIGSWVHGSSDFDKLRPQCQDEYMVLILVGIREDQPSRQGMEQANIPCRGAAVAAAAIRRRPSLPSPSRQEGHRAMRRAVRWYHHRARALADSEGPEN